MSDTDDEVAAPSHRMTWVFASWVVVGLVLFVGGVQACGARSTGGETDTSTDWLSQCVDDGDCSGARTCECGVCTEACDSDTDCWHLSEQAACAESPKQCGSVPLCVSDTLFSWPAADTSTVSSAGTADSCQVARDASRCCSPLVAVRESELQRDRCLYDATTTQPPADCLDGVECEGACPEQMMDQYRAQAGEVGDCLLVPRQPSISPPSMASGPSSADGKGECIGSAYECVGSELLQCLGGAWELVEDCGDKGCQAELGYCGCAPNERRCDVELDGTPILRSCPEGEFTGGTECDIGCQSVDGLHDYCAECTTPGDEACIRGDRYVCSEGLALETLEECANGCIQTGDQTRCE